MNNEKLIRSDLVMAGLASDQVDHIVSSIKTLGKIGKAYLTIISIKLNMTEQQFISCLDVLYDYDLIRPEISDGDIPTVSQDDLM